ncbi:hypothetical protein [Mesorhizobium muleiense]|nr:hypothetical protein [Mesorhizobium muleiense]MCF6108449.1 hypothetical protein [Mesorhizobium muleiense]
MTTDNGQNDDPFLVAMPIEKLREVPIPAICPSHALAVTRLTVPSILT